MKPLALAILLSLAPALAHAELLPGAPLMHSYSADETNASAVHYAIATDDEGRIYTAGADGGVLVYDGQHFQLVEMPLRHEAFSVVRGRDGKIYVAGSNTFGTIERAANGTFHYKGLMDAVQLPANQRRIGTVGELVALKDGVLFRGDNGTYELGYDHRTFKAWPGDNSLRRMYVANDVAYGWVRDVGLVQLRAGKQSLVAGGETFADRTTGVVIGVLAQKGWNLVVARNGFYRLDGQGLRKLADVAVAESPEQAGREVVQLHDGSLVVGTSDGHLLHYAADFQLKNRITLKPNQIEAFSVDRENNLWVATTGELVRMSLPSPFSFVGAPQGVKDMVLHTAWHEGRLWLAGRGGLQAVTANADGAASTEALPWYGQLDTYAVRGTPAGLLVGDVTGVFVVDPGAKAPRRLFEEENALVAEIIISKHDPKRAYARGQRSLLLLEQQGDRWQLGANIPFEDIEPSTLIETAPNEIWINNAAGGPSRWTLDASHRAVANKHTFGAAEGLKLEEGGSWVNSLDGTIFVSTGQNVYRLDGSRFSPFTGAPFTLTDRPGLLSIVETAAGAFAAVNAKLWRRAPGTTTWVALDTGNKHEAMNSLELDADGIVRLGYNGVLQFDPTYAAPKAPDLTVAFAGSQVSPGDGGASKPLAPSGGAGKAAEVPFGSVLSTSFGAVSINSPVSYRYRVLGQYSDWSDWSDQRAVRFKAESPGEYRLQVQARAADGRVGSSELVYRVLPAWYQRNDLRLGGALVLLGLLALAFKELVRRRTERIAEHNRTLEASVAKRSHELAEAQRELAESTTVDRVTETSNKRAADNVLRREWVRCLDYQQPLSVLLIDVENIKHYSETHGYLQGDELLRSIAYCLKEMHDPDRELLARYDSEKFVLLLPGTTQQAAAERAIKIREGLEARVHGTTTSIGVAAMVPTLKTEPRFLLERGEAALIKAKRSGVNQVAVDEGLAAA